MVAQQAQAGSQIVENYVRTKLLGSGEVIVWRGRPNPTAAIWTQWQGLWTGLGFLLMGTLIVALSLASDDRGWIAVVFPGLGATIAAGGLWLISRLVRAGWLALNSYYIITNRKVVIVKAGRQPHIVTLERGEITDFEVRSTVPNRGNLVLRRSRSQMVTVGHKYTPAMHTEGVRRPRFYDGLWGIDDLSTAAEAVEALR